MTKDDEAYLSCKASHTFLSEKRVFLKILKEPSYGCRDIYGNSVVVFLLSSTFRCEEKAEKSLDKGWTF